MHQAKDHSRTAIDWRFPVGLLLAFVLHNMEEALTFGAYRETSQELIRRIAFRHYAAPSIDAFLIALAAVSICAALSMAWAIRHPSKGSALFLVKGLAWIMLLNVVLPHIPAAILLGGYAPGVVTAVFVNLPIAGLVLVRLSHATAQ